MRETIGWVRRAGATGKLTLRADSWLTAPSPQHRTCVTSSARPHIDIDRNGVIDLDVSPEVATEHQSTAGP